MARIDHDHRRAGGRSCRGLFGGRRRGVASPQPPRRAEAKAPASQRFNSIDQVRGAGTLGDRRVSTFAMQAGRASSMTTRDLPGPNRPKRNVLTSGRSASARSVPPRDRAESSLPQGRRRCDRDRTSRGRRLDRPGKIEAQLRRLAVFGQARRDRHRGAAASSAARGAPDSSVRTKKRRAQAPPRHDCPTRLRIHPN